MRFSSSFKVGLLTLIALIILLMTILWVKGRSFSSGERIEVLFKDVNGMRPGSGVQMMGVRVGQVEEIIPVIEKDSTYVKMKFVITAPNVKIPKASTISIQQSGLIGEQFLEITPPKIKYVYLPVSGTENVLYKNDSVEMFLDKKCHDIGVIKETNIVSSALIPLNVQEYIKTNYAYKVGYTINLPGLILPDAMKADVVTVNGNKKMRLKSLDGATFPLPQTKSPYTILEPMRISDFLDLQYKTAESLTKTNQKINDLLSDDIIVDLKQTVSNINELTAKATTTVGKAEILIDSSKEDLDTIMKMMDKVSTNFNKLSDNINNIIGDKEFKPTFISTADSVGKLANNLNKILDNTDAKSMANDLQIITRNVNEISTSVNSMTKDTKLKNELMNSVGKINKAMDDISSALAVVNNLTPQNKHEMEQIVDDTVVVTYNLRKFSEKLNKRFLLFRLMF